VSLDTPRRTSTQDRLPKTIGPYLIRERIGKGAMGVVYRATDESGRTEVALKVMASDLDGDPETRERFFREAHVAGKLRHPNIVSVRDSGEDNGRLYIAMELLRGATLTDVLKQHDTLDLEDRIDMMIQVCQGLTVAHAAGVFHRDLKPANLFLCEDRRVKILDFGVARLVGSNMTLTGNIIGTPDFMSPEQVRGADIDARSDIFSAGSVFYLLLTGRKPFAANDLPAVLNKVVRAQPLPIRDTEAPEVIATVIWKALAKDPAARQQEMRELACELMSAASEVARRNHQQALTVRRGATEMIRLAGRTRELAATLQLPEDGVRDPWPAIQEQFPMLRSGVEVLGTFPTRLRTVQELHDVIRGETEALTTQVNQLEEAHAKFNSGTALQQNGAFEHALKEFDIARRLAPASGVIASAIEECADALQKIRERDAQLQARLTLATEASERGDWDAVLAIAKELDELNASSPVIARLRNEATRQLESQRQRLARAAAARAAANPAPAPRPSGRHMAATSAAAGDSADGGEQGQSRSERTARGGQARKEAVRALIAGDLTNAEKLASEAVALNGADREARHLLESVRAAITLRAAQENNARRVTDLMMRAQTLAEEQKFEDALSCCDEALQIDPTNVQAIASRLRIAEDMAVHDEKRAADEATGQRLHAAAPALKQAKHAFENGDLERARWCAENALALAPDWSDAQALLTEITAAIPEPSPDDTVKLSDPQSDETAELAPLRDTASDVADDAGTQRPRWWRPVDAKAKG
jgi:tetratricopeptide (TPR) repeat protein